MAGTNLIASIQSDFAGFVRHEMIMMCTEVVRVGSSHYWGKMSLSVTQTRYCISSNRHPPRIVAAQALSEINITSMADSKTE